MADEPNLQIPPGTTPATAPTSPSVTQPGERTADGTIKDQSPIQPPTSTKTDSSDKGPSTDAKDGKADDKSTFNKDKPAGAGAPESYADFKLPDGLKLDDAAIKEATGVFKELGLSQESAQRLVDFHAKQLQAVAEGPINAYIEMKKGWGDEVTKTYGKDIEPGGKHFTSVGGLLEQLGPAETPFREAMDVTGIGSHPAFVAAFIKLAEMLGSGTHVRGGGPSPLGQSDPSKGGTLSLAQQMYPHLPSAG